MEFRDLYECVAQNMKASVPSGVVESMTNEFVLTREKLGLSQFGCLVQENQLMEVEYLLRSGQDVNERMYQGRNALHFAVEAGLKDMAVLLVHHGISINVADSSGFTPLHIACFCRHKVLVQFLLSKGANIHDECVMGTPILAASFIPNPSRVKDPTEIIEILLEHGANVNDVSIDDTPLTLAVRSNNLRLVKVLIKANADVNVLVKINYTGEMPIKIPLLSVALLKNFFEIVKCLLQVDTLDVKTKENDRRPPLHMACALGQLDIVKLMVERKFDINEVTAELKTPLNLAIQKQNFQVAEFLLEQDTIDVNPFHPFGNLLDLAIEVGNQVSPYQKRQKQKVINAIIDKTTTDLDAEWVSRSLSIAKRFRDGETIKYLENQRKERSKIGQQSNTEASETVTEKIKEISLKPETVTNDITPESDIKTLTSAIEEGDFETVKKLLNDGAELTKEAVEKNRSTRRLRNKAKLAERKKINDLIIASLQLMTNVRRNRIQKVKENIEEGACVNVFDRLRGPPLFFASSRGFGDIVDILLENGANVNFKSATGFTSLHMACRFNTDSSIVVKLLNHGAYYNMTDDNSKKTPLQYARSEKNEAAAKLLKCIESMFRDVRKGKLEVSDKAVLNLKMMKNVRNKDGQTLLDLARGGKFSERLVGVLEKLLEDNGD